MTLDKRRGGGGGGGAGGGGDEAKARSGGGGGSGAARLEADSESFKHVTIELDMARAIQRARLDKKMTQKDLAAAIMERADIVNAYEAGKAMPNPTIIQKIERALGVKLPRPAKKK